MADKSVSLSRTTWPYSVGNERRRKRDFFRCIERQIGRKEEKKKRGRERGGEKTAN